MQDLLLRNASDVFDIINKSRGHIYVCGDVTMAADVAEIIEVIGTSIGEMSQGEAKEWMTRLRVCVLGNSL